MGRLITTTLVLALLSTTHQSSAGAEGNHFIAEGSIGIMHGLSDGDTTDVGHATSVLVGVGGRPAGSWLRYFFIIEGVFGSYTRSHYQNYRVLEISRSVFDVGAGMRIVAPIFIPQLRFFVDGELVIIGSGTEFDGDHLATNESSELDGGVRFALGLQFRPLEFLSVGARMSLTSAFDHFDSDGGRGWLVGFDSEAGHFETTAAVTFYF